MDTNPSQRPQHNVIMVLVLLLILLAGFAGWLIADRNNKTDDTATTSTPDKTTEQVESTTPVGELVSYTLPNGWEVATCADAEGVEYFVRDGQTPDCSDEPEDAIMLVVDSQNRTDCNQLQNVQDVSKHICKSIFIDNHKTLQAQTIYNQDSSVLPGRTVDAYYMDTGNGVVLARYIYMGDADDGTAFNDLVNSLRVTN